MCGLRRRPAPNPTTRRPYLLRRKSAPAKIARCLVSLFCMAVLAGCRPNPPRTVSEVVSRMVHYGNTGRPDQAIRTAQDWLREHPGESNDGLLYNQIALLYLVKASKDARHKGEWIQEAVTYLEKDLAAHSPTKIDMELYNIGQAFRVAGDLSADNRCLYYERAAKALEDEFAFIQGDTITAYGKTLPLAPARRDNQKALDAVKAKLATAGCPSR